MSQTLISLENEYTPDVVSAPGDTLQEMLDDRLMTQTDLAERLGLAQKTVNEIIRGRAPLTQETAIGLETVLGVPASFWISYESAYRESLTRGEIIQNLLNYAHWLDRIPWKKAVGKGWIPQRVSIVEQMLEILRFLGIASPKQYDEVYGSLIVQWKRSESRKVDRDAAAFWLRKGEIEAIKLMQNEDIIWNDYDPREFERVLSEVRSLTRDREPLSFVPKLQALCARAGVAVVFVPELEGTRAGGATRWLSPVRALIQLSLRYSTNDHLWFNFFHEAAHILKHSKKRLFLEQDGKDQDEQEREADEFAQNFLIPAKEFALLRQMGKPTKDGVEQFAAKIGVDPGIVVGRLQKDKLIERNWFNDLKQRYQW